MKVEELKTWMAERKLRVVDVAYLSGLDPNTVRSFLHGKRVMRGTLLIIKQMMDQHVNTVNHARSEGVEIGA